MYKFKLSKKFIEKYVNIKPPFGFNGLGEIVYYRTYSRIKEDGTNEKWYETVERVVNGTYNMQKQHIELHGLHWDNHKSQKSAQEMYDRIFNMKFLPPGRGLWAQGSPIIEDKGLHASLNNCGFCTTANLKEDCTAPFTFLMDGSMLGVGIGFDTKGEGSITIKGPNKKRKKEIYTIDDTREGWVESVKLLLESYFLNQSEIEFDYSLIRKEGEQIKGFGGKSSGPKPLEELHNKIRDLLNRDIGEPISVTNIVDIMNLIGRCVVAGNVRRCIPEDYEVDTKTGFKPIKDLNIGEYVKTNSGYKTIKNKFDSGEQKLIKFKTLNSTEYEVTHKHTLLVYDKKESKFKWIMAKDINKENHFLVKPKK